MSPYFWDLKMEESAPLLQEQTCRLGPEDETCLLGLWRTSNEGLSV